ncbi:MAG: PAC2 family protein [archaeon]|jgi:uncharacterized protein
MSDKEKIINIIETKNISMKGFTFIEGFPDLGLAGTIGARYIIEKLKFEQVGFIDSKAFMPMIRIHNGMPVHPVKIYANKKSKVVIIVAEQIIENMLAAPMAEELVSWIKRKGITRVISTSGVRIPDGPSVYAFASNEKSKKIIKENKIDIIENGVTSGVTALLMLYLKDNNVEAFCLLGNAKNNADYNAAAEVVKTICSITKMTLDVKPLLNEAKILEQSLVKHLQAVEESKDCKLESTPMYT